MLFTSQDGGGGARSEKQDVDEVSGAVSSSAELPLSLSAHTRENFQQVIVDATLATDPHLPKHTLTTSSYSPKTLSLSLVEVNISGN